MVEGRHEIFFPAFTWSTERFERAAAVRWYEEIHALLTADFLEAFFEAIEHAVIGSALLNFNPNTPDDLRMREIFNAYMAWDMTEYRAGAVDVQLHNQRREALARAELQEYAREFARERALRLQAQEAQGQDVD
jgi:hypothetical protein